jgi:cytochrome bd-type quinol oxidase subunit 2
MANRPGGHLACSWPPLFQPERACRSLPNSTAPEVRRRLSAEPLAQLAARSTRRIWVLLVVLALTGLQLITAEPGRTITNPVFYLKMIMLAAVIVVSLLLGWIARRVERPNALHIALAVLAVLLWIGIIFAGRLIAYIEAN